MTHDVRITDARAILLADPCTGDPNIQSAARLRSAALIEIHTDGLHTGTG